MARTKYIKKLLMCRPLHFRVDYAINPWMQKDSVDQIKAMDQWESLVETFQRTGITVDHIDQVESLPDMVFSADQGVVLGNRFVVSNFKYPERQGETAVYCEWFRQNGFELHNLPNGHFFEGTGESCYFDGKLLVGSGFRSTKSSCPYIAEILNIDVIPLEMVDPRFYHLDVCFLPLNSTTAFFYPPAFSLDSLTLLHKLVPNLIDLTYEEAFGFSANAVITDNHAVIQSGNNSFADKLRSLGYKPIFANVSEFIKAGGGIHCLTQTLEEEYV